MRFRVWRRGAVALATAMTVLTLGSAPGSATAMELTAGTINIGTETFVIGGGPPDKCTPALGPQYIDIQLNGGLNSGFWALTGSFKLRFRLAPPNDAQYWQADSTILAGTGIYSNLITPPPGYTHAMLTTGPHHITVETRYYRLTPPDCFKFDLACTVRWRLVLLAGSGINLPTTPGNTAVAIGTSNTPGGVPVTVIGGACPATLTSQLVGKHVSFPAPGGLSLTF